MEMRHILAPTDFSEGSIRALEYALGLAQTYGAKLTLLHVVELPSYLVDGHAPAHMSTALHDEMQRQAQRELAHLLPETRDAQVAIARQVVMGVPYQKILETAAAEKIDCIVMATHGRTGLSHMLMGSVAERVLRLAPCPVLTLRPTTDRG
jgi:nucleotide-binding universal stress UspA family protein